MINIRSIQHYMYCPRRFALMDINKDWVENVFVVKANIMHENVHSGKHEYKSSDKVVLSSVALYNDDFDMYGVADCIEFCKSKDGVRIEELGGRFKVRIIEYKPTQPKDGSVRETDAIQVFAQKLCADYIWNCDSEGYIYYCDTRRRVKMPFDEEYEKYRNLFDTLTFEMEELAEKGVIPERKKKQNCSGCSMRDVCMPQTKRYSVKRIIEESV